MKTRVLIGLLLVLVLSVSLVWAQCSSSETASCSDAASAKLTSADAKPAASCSSTATAKLASVDAKPDACCSGTATAKLASVVAKPAASCSSTATAKLTSVDAKPGACCSSASPAKLASVTSGCPLQAAGIELCTKQQAQVQAILGISRGRPGNSQAGIPSSPAQKTIPSPGPGHLGIFPIRPGHIPRSESPVPRPHG